MAEIATQAVITVKKDDRLHVYSCANNTSLGEVFDVLQEMSSLIVSRITEAQKIAEGQKQPEAAEAPKED